jgi:DNA-binding beta-propeller fold protein YncE
MATTPREPSSRASANPVATAPADSATTLPVQAPSTRLAAPAQNHGATCGTESTAPRRSISGNEPEIPGTFGFWDRRHLTYAFALGPGTYNAAQTFSYQKAMREVRDSFAAWAKTTSLAQPGESFGFLFTELPSATPASPSDPKPDIIIEWVPMAHDAPTHDDQGGQWLISDTIEMLPSTGAHAGPPPASVGGTGDFLTPPVPVHFNEFIETTAGQPLIWDRQMIRLTAIHELGHVLGLRHPENNSTALSVMHSPNSTLDPGEYDRDLLDKLYGIPGRPRFNFVWMQGNLPREVSWGRPLQEVKDSIVPRKAGGFVPGRINAYVLPEGARYNVIWDKLPFEQERPCGLDISREAFDGDHAALTSMGLRLIDINTFVNGDGDLRFNAVWARTVEDMKYFMGTPLGGVQTILDDMLAKKYRPTVLNTFENADGAAFANLIFVKQGQLGPARDWRARVSLRRNDFKVAAKSYESSGFMPTNLHTRVAPSGGGEFWSGIWEQLPQVRWESQGQYVQRDAERHTRILENSTGLRAWDVNAYVLPPVQTTTQIVSQPQTPVGLRGVVLGVACDRDRIYATRYDELIKSPHSSASVGTLLVIDRATFQVTHQVQVGHKPRSVAVNPVTGRIYVVNGGNESYSVTVIDGGSLTPLVTIPLGQGPTHVAVNSRTNRIYVSNFGQGRIHVIDGDTHQVLSPILIGPGPQGLTVDESTNTVYVALSHRTAPLVNGLGTIIDDGVQRQMLPIVPIEKVGIESLDVAVDAEADRLYVANQGNVSVGPPSVTVLQRSSRTVLATVPLTSPARSVAVNSDARDVYVGTDGGVHVINASTLTVARVQANNVVAWAVATGEADDHQVFVGDAKTGSVTRLA